MVLASGVLTLVCGAQTRARVEDLGPDGGAPDVKCSMMAANTSGLSMLQARSSLLVTVTKSEPKKTLVTPSMANSRLASGDAMPSRAFAKSLLPLCAHAGQRVRRRPAPGLYQWRVR